VIQSLLAKIDNTEWQRLLLILSGDNGRTVSWRDRSLRYNVISNFNYRYVKLIELFPFDSAIARSMLVLENSCAEEIKVLRILFVLSRRFVVLSRRFVILAFGCSCCHAILIGLERRLLIGGPSRMGIKVSLCAERNESDEAVVLLSVPILYLLRS